MSGITPNVGVFSITQIKPVPSSLLAWCLSNLHDEVSDKPHLPLVPWDSHQINQGRLSPKRFVWGSGLMNELIAKATQFGAALAVFSLHMWHPDEYISGHLCLTCRVHISERPTC